ncbi:MAG: STAS domain-containing protein [Patescibacteria group bacterium]
MHIYERTVGDVTILDVQGRITLGEGDELLKDKINSLLYQEKKKVLLDMGSCHHVDPAGLGEIVRSYSALTRHGGKIKFVFVTRPVRDLFVITKLDSIFESFDDEAEALASFNK